MIDRRYRMGGGVGGINYKYVPQAPHKSLTRKNSAEDFIGCRTPLAVGKMS